MAQKQIKNSFKIRDIIKTTTTKEVMVIKDVKGRGYAFDGANLYRLIPLKGL